MRGFKSFLHVSLIVGLLAFAGALYASADHLFVRARGLRRRRHHQRDVYGGMTSTMTVS